MRSAYYCAVGEVAGFVSGSPATIGFANTWRDEMGRFAEKGYVAASGRGTRWDLEHGEVVWYDEPNGMWTSAAWAKKHYGAAEVALQMTDAERAVLQTELDVKLGTVMDADPTGLAFDMQRIVASAGGPLHHYEGGAFVSVVGEFTVGQSMQLVSTYEYLSQNAASRDGAKAALDEMIHDHAKYGEPTASSISEFVASRYLVPQEAGAVSYFHKGWQESSASIRSQVLQDAAHAVFSGPAESRSSFRNFAESHPTYNADKYSVMSGHLSATARSVVSASSRVTADMIGTGDLTLMRGTSNPNIRYGRDFLMNPASSWTTDLETASGFGAGGAVIETVLSKNNVIGYEGIGFGSAKESEYVVAGGIIHSDNWDTIDAFATGIDTDPVYIDGDEYGGPDWIKEVSTGDEASFTIDGSTEFANTWRDEMGRFAEKGYQSFVRAGRNPTSIESILDKPPPKVLAVLESFPADTYNQRVVDPSVYDAVGAAVVDYDESLDRPTDWFLDYEGKPISTDAMQVARVLVDRQRVAERAEERNPFDSEFDASWELSNAIDGAPVSMRVSPEALDAIIADGKFMSLPATGKTAGYPDVGSRLRHEMFAFGLDPRQTPAAERPVYGYLDVQRSNGVGSEAAYDQNPGAATGNSSHWSELGQYGRVTVEFGANVNGRTTFTIGDSFHRDTRASWIENPSSESMLYVMGRGSLTAGINSSRYVEAQIHGATTRDIAHVYFDKAPGPSTIAALDDNDIDWSLSPDAVVEFSVKGGPTIGDVVYVRHDGATITATGMVDDEQQPLGFITDGDGVVYDPLPIVALLARCGWVSVDTTFASFTIEHFANPWRDYKGRFAPTGYGRSGRLGPRSLNDDSDRYQSGALQSDAKFAAGLEEWSDSITEDMEKMIGEPVVAKWGHSEADGQQAFFNMSFETLDGREVADIEREFDTDYDGVLFMSATSLFVGGRFRGNGVGTLMQESFEDFAVAQGAERVELTAVSAGKWAWMKAGYDFNPADTTPKELEKIAAAISGVAGTSRLTEAERDTAVRYVSEFKNAATHMESNETFPDSMPTPFELSQLLTSVEVTDPVFEFPTWSGIKNLGSGLVASAGGSRADRVAAVVAAYDVWWLDNMEAVDPTADSYVEFDYSGLDVLVDGGALAASGTIVEFANTWRDEMGRFAPKGYIVSGASASRRVRNPPSLRHKQAYEAMIDYRVAIRSNPNASPDELNRAIMSLRSCGIGGGCDEKAADLVKKVRDDLRKGEGDWRESLPDAIDATAPMFEEKFDIQPPPDITVTTEIGASGDTVYVSGKFRLVANDITIDQATEVLQAAVVSRQYAPDGYYDGTPHLLLLKDGDAGLPDQKAIAWVNTGMPTTINLRHDYFSLERDVNNDPWASTKQGDASVVSQQRFTTMHEMAHSMLYSEYHENPTAGQAMLGKLPRMLAKHGHSNLVSDYAKTAAVEMHAEVMASWINTGGTTNNPVVRDYAREFGWPDKDGNVIPYDTPEVALSTINATISELIEPMILWEAGVGVGGQTSVEDDADSDVSLTISTSVEFANTWRDEMGRFAEKGYNFVRATKNLTAFETFADDLPQAIEDAYLENAVGNPSGYQAVREVIEHELNKAGFDDVMLGEDQHGKYSLGDLIYETVDKRERAATNAADLVEQAASSEGITNEEYEAKFIESAENVLADSEVSIRIDESALKQVVRDGEFKTQFETGTSRGTLNHDIREKVEAIQFGLDPEETHPTDRPIYGYMDVDGANDYSPDNTAKSLGADAYGRQESLSQYGSVRVVLKDRVRGRTTFTSGDSLAMGKRASPINAPQIDSFANNWELPADIGLDGQNAFSTTMRYVEAQIHGGVMVDDISHVVFESAPSSTGWLDDAGIAHSVAADYDPYDFGLSIVASAGADVLYVRGDGAEILDAGADADGRPLGQVRDGERVWLPQLLVTILVHGYWTAVPEIAGLTIEEPVSGDVAFAAHDLIFWERRRTPSVVPKGKPAHRVKKPSYGKVVKRRPATADEEKTIRSGGWVRVNKKGEKPSDPNYKKSKSKMRPQHNSLGAATIVALSNVWRDERGRFARKGYTGGRGTLLTEAESDVVRKYDVWLEAKADRFDADDWVDATLTVQAALDAYVDAYESDAVSEEFRKEFGRVIEVRGDMNRHRAAIRAAYGDPETIDAHSTTTPEEAASKLVDLHRTTNDRRLNTTKDRQHEWVEYGTPAESAIGGLIADWSGRPAGVREMRSRLAAGDAEALLARDVIRAAPPSEIDLYRGFDVQSGTPQAAALKNLKPGDTIDMDSIGSFSESRDHANGFGETLITLTPGAAALPIASISNTPFEREWLVAGDMTVTGIGKTHDGEMLVEVEYAGVSAAPNDLEFATAEELAEISLLLGVPLHLDPNHPPVGDVNLTIDTSVQFANVWRDEIGRFAEKGYTASSGEGTRYQFGDNRHWSEPLVNVSYSHENEDGEQEWVSDAWALKHYGSIETSFEMTESEREALRAELDNMTIGQLDELLSDGARANATYFLSRLEIIEGSYGEMTAGQAMQFQAMMQFSKKGLPSHAAADRDGWTSQKYDAMLSDFKSGKISADEWSDRVAAEYGVTIESAAVSWVHEQWAGSSSKPSSVAAMRSVSERHGLGVSMGRYEDWISSATTESGSGSSKLQRSYQMSAELGGTIDAVTGSTYRKTQQMLSEANIDGLTVHRGVTAKGKYSGLEVDGTLTANPLSSWSSNVSVAIEFATTYQADSDNSVVVSSSIENSDVWGFSGIGAGSSEEAEFILLGNDVVIGSIETEFAVAGEPVYIDDTQYGGPDWIKKAGDTRNA